MEFGEKIKDTSLIMRGDLPQLHRLNIPTVLNMDGSSGMFSYDDKYEDSGFKTESEKMAPTKKVAGCIFGEPLNLRPVIPCDQFIRNYNNTNTNTYISIYESYRRKFKTKRRRTANVHKRCTTKAEDLSKVAKRSCSAIDCIGPSSKTDSEAGSSQMKMPTKRRRTEPAWLTSGDYQLF